MGNDLIVGYDGRARCSWAGAGDRVCIGRASAQKTDTTECRDAERKTHGPFEVLSHSVPNLHGF